MQSQFTSHHTRHWFLIGLSALITVSAASMTTVSAQDYPPDPARGKAIYQRHCEDCHGLTGQGDGPAAASLKIPPANLQRPRSFLKSDEELFRTIEHGVVFSPMHSWRGQLTDGEMQDVVAYIRVLSQ
jgi:mono/diheme cytochrome c family protein